MKNNDIQIAINKLKLLVPTANLKDLRTIEDAFQQAYSSEVVSELIAIAKKAAEEADQYGWAEFNDDSEQHTKAIADWERRANISKKG